MASGDQSLSISNPHPPFVDGWQKLFAAIAGVGLLILFLAFTGVEYGNRGMWLAVALTSLAVGISGYGIRSHRKQEAGIQNNGAWFSTLTNRGMWGWVVGVIFTTFYVLLYWFPSVLGMHEGGNTGLIGLFDPLSQWIKGKPASQWFMYGCFYTIAILFFGVKFLWKYRHTRHQQIRTASVMFFQLIFAFTIPEVLERLNQPSMDLKNIWPLNYYFFFDWNLDRLLEGGTLGVFMLGWGIALILLISPILAWFYGKRWYCSWVCGCGGLAETAGDPFRHLSDNSLKAWRIERWMVHGVLVFAVVMTAFVLYTYFTGHATLLGLNSYSVREVYGFLIGGIFSGVIGVGFYPLMGSRVWCRFGCPMAAILGIQQKYFSRFRITTNGGQCISCGNCSTYCEMGIDVKWYAQRGQNIVRASCVGCGICAEVCPRGVLRLENGSVDMFNKTDKLRTVHVKEEEVGRIDA